MSNTKRKIKKKVKMTFDFPVDKNLFQNSKNHHVFGIAWAGLSYCGRAFILFKRCLPPINVYHKLILNKNP